MDFRIELRNSHGRGREVMLYPPEHVTTTPDSLPVINRSRSMIGLALHAKSLRTSKKSKGFPYSLPSVRPGADPSVQAVSQQVT